MRQIGPLTFRGHHVSTAAGRSLVLSAKVRALTAAGKATFPLRPPSPRKLEPHEVIAKLKARATHRGEQS